MKSSPVEAATVMVARIYLRSVVDAHPREAKGCRCGSASTCRPITPWRPGKQFDVTRERIRQIEVRPCVLPTTARSNRAAS